MRSVNLQHIDLTPSSKSILKEFTLYKMAAENARYITLKGLADNLIENTFRNLHILYVRKKLLTKKQVSQ